MTFFADDGNFFNKKGKFQDFIDYHFNQRVNKMFAI